MTMTGFKINTKGTYSHLGQVIHIRGGITERCQLAHGHQNLNVMLRETKQFRRRRSIKACGKSLAAVALQEHCSVAAAMLPWCCREKAEVGIEPSLKNPTRIATVELQAQH